VVWFKAEVARMRDALSPVEEFARNVTNKAADLKIGPPLDSQSWDFVCWLYEYGCEQLALIEALRSEEAV
jgi:hypothetical protein